MINQMLKWALIIFIGSMSWQSLAKGPHSAPGPGQSLSQDLKKEVPQPQKSQDITPSTAVPRQVNPSLGFQEWKQAQIDKARYELDQMRQEDQPAKVEAPSQAEDKGRTPEAGEASQQQAKGAGLAQDSAGKEPAPAEKSGQTLSETDNGQGAGQGQAVSPQEHQQAEKLRQLEFNLEIAQGLTVHDYFALYLKEKSKTEMAQAIKKLSPEDLSELLSAYRKALYGPPINERGSQKTLEQSL